MQHVDEKKFMKRDAMTFLVLALLVAPAILDGKKLHAQTHTPQAKQPEPQAVAGGADQSHLSADVDADAARQRQSPPLASSAPIWPANQPPNPAIVRWNSGGLEIEASNSSLDQILRQVAVDTGAKLEGLTQDQRIFGNYGPGPESDVLSKLLEGSGYNVLIFGSRNAEVPLAIILSARSPVSPQMASSNRSHSYSQVSKPLEPERRPDDPSGAPSSQGNQDPYNVGGQQRDPVQFMQEVLQRQQVIDQQQQDQRNGSR